MIAFSKKNGQEIDCIFVIIFYLRNHHQSGTELNLDMNFRSLSSSGLNSFALAMNAAKHN